MHVTNETPSGRHIYRYMLFMNISIWFCKKYDSGLENKVTFIKSQIMIIEHVLIK